MILQPHSRALELHQQRFRNEISIQVLLAFVCVWSGLGRDRILATEALNHSTAPAFGPKRAKLDREV